MGARRHPSAPPLQRAHVDDVQREAWNVNHTTPPLCVGDFGDCMRDACSAIARQAGPSWQRVAPASGSASVLVASAATGAASMQVLSDAARLATSSTKAAFSLASLSSLSALALSSAAQRASSSVKRAISDGQSAFSGGSVCRVL